MAQRDHGLSYRVVPVDGTWKWEVVRFGKRIGDGVEQTPVEARVQAMFFAIEAAQLTSLTQINSRSVQ